MQNTLFNIVLIVSFVTISFLYIMWQVNVSENQALKKQIVQLEAIYTLNPAKIKPIIKYRDKKIEVIKKIPVVVDSSDCKRELENVKRIIDTF